MSMPSPLIPFWLGDEECIVAGGAAKSEHFQRKRGYLERVLLWEDISRRL